jgi:hypothetical protein
MGIAVESTAPATYRVTVTGGASTTHMVTVSPGYWRKLTGGRVPPEKLVENLSSFSWSARATPAFCGRSICR